jgi:ubiquinone/menaquinone biosynthesis C-methylase UbiE
MKSPNLLFSCPKCRGNLQQTPENWQCNSCKAEYPIRGDIHDFRCARWDYYFNPVPRKEMTEMIEDSRKGQPWYKTIRRFMGHVRHNPDWLDNLTADGRYAWKLLLNMPSDGRMLDLGCGLGNLTRNLAPQTGQVYAMDLTWERLEFAKRRFELFNANDNVVTLAGGDGPNLPFPDASFDCVALSGVLEWVASDGDTDDPSQPKLAKAARMFFSYFGERHPRTVQLKFLKEIKRILKPTGQLFVAIENRLNAEYFGGRPDHHSNLLYGSLLPRFVANVYSIVSSRQPYRTYTYSVAGYRRLFRSAGFDAQQFFGLFPGYSHLAETRPLETDKAIWQADAGQKPTSLKDAVRHNKFFVPAYGIIASQSDAPSVSLIERIGEKINAQVQSKTGLALSTCRVTAKEKGVLLGNLDGQPIVVKIPFGANAALGEAKHAQMVKNLLALPGFSAILPAPVVTGEVQNLHYYVESRVDGEPLSEKLSASNRATYLTVFADIQRTLNPNVQRKETVQLTGEIYHRIVTNPLKKVLAVIDRPDLAVGAERYFRDQLEGARVITGLEHGDFSVNNIFVSDGRVSGILDWECADTDGLPILDAFNYLDSVERHLNPGTTIAETIPMLANLAWNHAEEHQYLTHLTETFGLERRHHAAYAYLYWLRHVAQQLDSGLIYDSKAIERKVIAVLDSLVNQQTQAVVV